MKKVVIAIFIAILGLSSAQAKSADKSVEKEIKALVEKYDSERGFECVTIGSFAMGLLKSLASIGMETDEINDLEAFKDIKSMIVIEYSDMAPYKVNAFNQAAQKILEKEELILEVKDDGDLVLIYGKLNEKAGKVSDIVVYNPSESDLVYFVGSVSLALLGALAD